MKETELIQIALMLTPPWKVAEWQFDVNQKRPDSSQKPSENA